MLDPPGLPVPVHDPEQVRDAARRIVEGDDYEANISWIERVLRWLADLFPDSVGGSGGSAAFSWLLALALVGLVVFLVLRLRRRVHHSAAPPVATAVVHQEEGPPDWTSEAVTLEGRGDWKGGLRCRYRDLVGALTAKGAVPDIAGRTSGELRRDVRTTAPDGADDFAAASELFDRAWYGDRPTGPDESVRFQEHASRVLEATES